MAGWLDELVPKILADLDNNIRGFIVANGLESCSKCGKYPIELGPVDHTSSRDSFEDLKDDAITWRVRQTFRILPMDSHRCEPPESVVVEVESPICGDSFHRHFGPCKNYAPGAGS